MTWGNSVMDTLTLWYRWQHPGRSRYPRHLTFARNRPVNHLPRLTNPSQTLYQNKMLNAIDSTTNRNTSTHLSRWQLAVLRRPGIDHTRLTCQNLFIQEVLPVCEVCDILQTVRNLLLDCSIYVQERKECKLVILSPQILSTIWECQ